MLKASQRLTAEPIYSVLFQAARPCLTGRTAFRASTEQLPDSAWEELIRLAEAHGLTAFLAQRLLTDCDDLLPDDLAEACRIVVSRYEANFAAGCEELATVLHTLAAEGIVAAAFKGPALATQVRQQPWLRGFRDLDFLLRPDQWEPARAALERMGYVSSSADLPPGRRQAYYRYNGEDLMLAPDRVPIEPHWAFAPSTFCVETDARAILDRAVNIGSNLRGLSPEDALLAAAIHGAKEQWAKLIWISDIAAMFDAWPGLDVEAVIQRADQAGCRRMVLLAAVLARDLFRAVLPPTLHQLTQSDSAVASLAEQVYGFLLDPSGLSDTVFSWSRFYWRSRERFADRIRYAWRTLFTPRTKHFRDIPLPERLAFLYPVVAIAWDGAVIPLWIAIKRLRGAVTSQSRHL